MSVQPETLTVETKDFAAEMAAEEAGWMTVPAAAGVVAALPPDSAKCAAWPPHHVREELKMQMANVSEGASWSRH